MDIAKSVFGFFLGILSSSLSREITEELRAWTPTIVLNLIQFAVSRLPEAQRERFQEEWLCYAVEVPGELGKIMVSLGFVTAAVKISLIVSTKGKLGSTAWIMLSQVTSLLMIVIFFPMLCVLWVLIALQNRGPVIVTAKHRVSASQVVTLYRFSVDTNGLLGKYMRQTSTDTLPFLFNILRGELTFSDLIYSTRSS